MFLLVLKEILSIFDEEKIPNQNKKTKAFNKLKKDYNKILIQNNHLKRLLRQDKERIQKTKYLCAALRPAMEKIELQNIDAVNAFLSQPPIRNLF